jgi:hypothetical protein
MENKNAGGRANKSAPGQADNQTARRPAETLRRPMPFLGSPVDRSSADQHVDQNRSEETKSEQFRDGVCA